MKNKLTQTLERLCLYLCISGLVVGIYAVVIQSNVYTLQKIAIVYMMLTSALWSGEQLLRLWDYIVFKKTHKPVLLLTVIVNETPLNLEDCINITNSIKKQYMGFVEHKSQYKDKYDNNFLLDLYKDKYDNNFLLDLYVARTRLSVFRGLKNVNCITKVDCKYAKEFLSYIGSDSTFAINDAKIIITLDFVKKH